MDKLESLLQKVIATTNRIPIQGQTTAAGSTPVVIASDQPAIPVTTTPSGTQTVAISQTGDNNAVDVLTLPAITGTVTANAGTNLNTSALALEATAQSILTELGQKTEPSNTQLTKESQQATATITRVATSTSSAQLAAANTNRIQLTVVNDSAATLFVKYGTTASSTDYTWKLGPDEVAVVTRYTGRVDGIVSTGTGNAQVTEL